jgi:peptidoglycan/xylan/chitin deacetylase (PgdA/CDA1 family)
MDNKAEEDYWLQMTGEQIRELSASEWVTIGCHGYYHNDLARIGIDEAANEMALSKQYLEKLTDREINALAFPYGTYSRSVVSAAKKESITRLLALDFHFPEDRSDPAMRERLIVDPFISVHNQMLATIKRTYAIRHRE